MSRQLFAIKSKKNIVFLINLKAKKVFGDAQKKKGRQKFWGCLKKGRQKNLGRNVQKRTTLGISRRYMGIFQNCLFVTA